MNFTVKRRREEGNDPAPLKKCKYTCVPCNLGGIETTTCHPLETKFMNMDVISCKTCYKRYIDSGMKDQNEWLFERYTLGLAAQWYVDLVEGGDDPYTLEEE